MKLTIVVHDTEEGGYWVEVPAIAGCVSQGDSIGELLENVREAIEGVMPTEEQHDATLDDPFHTFEEWHSEADTAAYADL